MSALSRLRKTYPFLKSVRDAKKGINISIHEKDAKSGRKKDPENCALARACVRQHIADAAVIGIGTSYLIKGEVAIRYKTSQTVAREITSFDRHQDFAAGRDYKLSAPCLTSTLEGAKHYNAQRKNRKLNPKRDHEFKAKYHHTANIRSSSS